MVRSRVVVDSLPHGRQRSGGSSRVGRRTLFLRHRTCGVTGRDFSSGCRTVTCPPRRSFVGSLLDRSARLRGAARPPVRVGLVVVGSAGGEYGTVVGCLGIRCSLVGLGGRILLGLVGRLGVLGLMGRVVVRRVGGGGGRISLCGLWRSVRGVRWCCSVPSGVSGLWGRLRGCRRYVCCRWPLLAVGDQPGGWSARCGRSPSVTPLPGGERSRGRNG